MSSQPKTMPRQANSSLTQLRFAKILAQQEDYEEAFKQLEYMFDFYARDCPYLELVEYGYKLVNTMRDKRKTWFGFSFLSNTQIRRNYESIVRRAPGAAYVPEAMLKIAKLLGPPDKTVRGTVKSSEGRFVYAGDYPARWQGGRRAGLP